MQGLEFSQIKGVLHNDIKEGNILLFQEDDELIAKIADFGAGLISFDHSISYLPGMQLYGTDGY